MKLKFILHGFHEKYLYNRIERYAGKEKRCRKPWMYLPDDGKFDRYNRYNQNLLHFMRKVLSAPKDATSTKIFSNYKLKKL
jgi:hypothetical protein